MTISEEERVRNLLENNHWTRSKREFLERRLEEREKMRKLVNSFDGKVVKIKRYPGDIVTSGTVMRIKATVGILHYKDEYSACLEEVIYPNYMENNTWWYTNRKILYSPEDEICIESVQYNKKLKWAGGFWVNGNYQDELWARGELVSLENMGYTHSEWKELVKQAIVISGGRQKYQKGGALLFDGVKHLFEEIIDEKC